MKILKSLIIYPEITYNLDMFHPCGHPQWRAEGVCIGSCHRAEMGLTGKRDSIKRPCLPDFEAYVSTTDKKQYP